MIGQPKRETDEHELGVRSANTQALPAPLPPLRPELVTRVLWMPVDGLGDLVMSMPALHNLVETFSRAKVDVLAREAYVAFFQSLPFVREVITFEPPGLPERTRRSANRREILAMILDMRRRRYDLAIDVGGKDLYRQIALLSGARYRVSPARSHFDPKNKRNWASAMTHPVSMGTEKRHTVENALHVMRHIGVSTKSISFFSDDGADARREAVARRLRQSGVRNKFAVIHAASAVAEKQWQPYRFAAVADHLIQRHDFDIVLTGVDKDVAYNENIVRFVTHRGRVFNEAGEFGLQELPWLYQQADLMVTIDTGPMHIAAGVGAPIVSLFLPGSVHLYHPYSQPESVIVPDLDRSSGMFAQRSLSRILAQEAAHSDRWMDMITVDEVIAAIERRLQSARSGCAKVQSPSRWAANAASSRSYTQEGAGHGLP